MKRTRIFALLLCVLGMSFPLLSMPPSTSQAGECSGDGVCSSNLDCGPDGECVKAPGHTCGICA